MGAITGFPSLSCPLYLKSSQENQANRTPLPKLSHTELTILLSYTWTGIPWANVCQTDTRQKSSFAQASVRCGWVIKTTFPCISFHFVVAKMTSKGGWRKGTESGMDGSQAPLLRVRSLTEERSGCNILQVRDELYTLIFFYFKGSTRHLVKIHWNISLISNVRGKTLKIRMRSPKSALQLLRNVKKSLIFESLKLLTFPP